MGLIFWLRELKNEIDPTIKELKFVIDRVIKNPLSLVGAMILFFFVEVALLAPLIAPPVPDENPYLIPYEGPTWGWYVAPLPSPPTADHPFGTLKGFDIFYGCIWGTRIAFVTSSLIIFGAVVIGLFIGCAAGFYGGLIDVLTMRVADIFFAFPGLLLALVLVVAWPPVLSVDFDPIHFTIAFSHWDKLLVALILVRWPSYARMIRGEIMKIKNEDYIEAANAIGCSSRRVLIRHILPNSIYPILIMAFLDIGGIVLSFATLSFLGYGPELGYAREGYTQIPMYADWGTIISHARNYIITVPSQDIFEYAFTFMMPILFISSFVVAWSLLGDAFRDVLDPIIRRR